MILMAAIPDDVKRQALSAVAAVKPNIQAVQQTGNSTPAPLTPNPELGRQVGEKLARMERAGYDQAERMKAFTKDDFSRG